MELILNLAWVLVAAAALASWSLVSRRVKGSSRRIAPQLLALGVLLLILFPAISITDDLWAVRNPAETDILVRRHDEATHHLGALPHGQPVLLTGRYEGPSTAELGYAALPLQELPFHQAPARFAIVIRPPPVL